MGKTVALPALLALVVLAEEGVRLVLRLALGRRKRARGQGRSSEPTLYGGLESLVSFSACLIAANRAVETEQPEPHISDPLAAGLCGREALEARRARDRTGPAPALPTAAPQPGPAQPQSQPRPIPRLIMRTKFFDDVVSVVTWRGAGAGVEPAGRSCHSQLAAATAAAGGSAEPCLQVVLLGSGLDARPWRLALPPGVRWFEVDRHDVLAAKRTRLGDLGAQTRADPNPAADSGSGSGPTQVRPGSGQGTAAAAAAAGSSSSGGGGGSGRGGDWRHPLRSAAWSCVAVDLQTRGWTRGLLEAGLDATSPVLWVLEGLLYYLGEEDVRALLKEAASVSAPGSILAASVIRASPGAGTAAGGNGNPAPPPQAPAPSSLEPQADATGKAAGAAAPASATMSVAAAAVDSGQGAGGGASRVNGGASAPGDGRASYKLNSEFKWKCREEIPKFFGDCGWRSLACLSWLEAAQSYGLPTADTAASSVYFVTTALA